jgi:hypothetical protein
MIRQLFVSTLFLSLLRISVGDGPRNDRTVEETRHLEAGQNCLYERGAKGKWVRDMTFAAHQGRYTEVLDHYLGATEERYREMHAEGKIKGGYRDAATFRWDEESSCSFGYVVREDLCLILYHLHVKRIFFIGDELTLGQAISLLMLMREKPTIESDTHFQTTIQCPQHGTFDIEIEFVRNDELLETIEIASLEDEITNCCDGMGYCYPFFDPYMNFDGRTLIVANTGLHQPSTESFEKSVIRFLRAISGFRRHSDWIFMRTSVPGHIYCQQSELHPLDTIDGFVKRQNLYGGDAEFLPAYNLTLMSDYNNLLKQIVMEFETVHVFDVFPMTVLRPDGHLSEYPFYRAESLPDDDCVQYGLPGKLS